MPRLYLRITLYSYDRDIVLCCPLLSKFGTCNPLIMLAAQSVPATDARSV